MMDDGCHHHAWLSVPCVLVGLCLGDLQVLRWRYRVESSASPYLLLYLQSTYPEETLTIEQKQCLSSKIDNPPPTIAPRDQRTFYSVDTPVTCRYSRYP
jgi:hypothetical protein